MIKVPEQAVDSDLQGVTARQTLQAGAAGWELRGFGAQSLVRLFKSLQTNFQLPSP